MLHCFIAGLRSDSLAYDLIKEKFVNVQAVLQRALDLESIYALWDQTRNREEGNENLFQIQGEMKVAVKPAAQKVT